MLWDSLAEPVVHAIAVNFCDAHPSVALTSSLAIEHKDEESGRDGFVHIDEFWQRDADGRDDALGLCVTRELTERDKDPLT